jgi:hypothetical protein
MAQMLVFWGEKVVRDAVFKSIIYTEIFEIITIKKLKNVQDWQKFEVGADRDKS